MIRSEAETLCEQLLERAEDRACAYRNILYYFTLGWSSAEIVEKLKDLETVAPPVRAKVYRSFRRKMQGQ